MGAAGEDDETVIPISSFSAEWFLVVKLFPYEKKYRTVALSTPFRYADSRYLCGLR